MPSPPSRDRGHFAILDVLRGGAALYVTAYHAVGSLTPSGLRFDTRGGSVALILEGNPLGLLGFGLYAVLGFFVLSGFVIHLRHASRPEELAQRGRLAWTADYGWRRSMRIYPPLLGAIALTAVLTAIGSRTFPDWPWAQGTLTDARNLLVPVHGAATFGNGLALWSIAFELWFYAAYALIAVVVLRVVHPSSPRRLGVVLAGTLMASAALVLIQDHAPHIIPAELQGLTSIAVYLPAWVAGAFLAELHVAGVRVPWPRWSAAAAGLVVVVAAFSSGNDLRPAVDLLWGLALCLVIAVATLGPGRRWCSSRAGRWAASTSSWSYSLYLVHLPVILFGRAALDEPAGRITNPLVVLAIFLAAVAVGWLFSLVVERPSRWLAARPPRRLAGSATSTT